MQLLSHLFLILGAALAGGLLAKQLNIPGGIIIGAMLGVIILKLLITAPLNMPKHWSFFLQVIVGATVGCRFSLSMLEQLKHYALPMLISAITLILIGGLLATIMSKYWGMDLTTAYISTSPGAMTAMTGMAGGMQVDLFLVLAFHIIRVVLVLLLAPLIIKICQLIV